MMFDFYLTQIAFLSEWRAPAASDGTYKAADGSTWKKFDARLDSGHRLCLHILYFKNHVFDICLMEFLICWSSVRVSAL